VTVSCAKRTGFLSETDKFYNFQLVAAELLPKILKGFALVKETFPDATEVVFFGELFGGLYPHPDVPRDSRFVHVQKGVYYSPAVHFYLFDIFVSGKSFLNFDLFEKIANTSGFLYSKPLQRGKFSDLVKFNVDTFVSTIPKELGYPELPTPNIAEGIIIKLVQNKYTFKGSRVMVKYKSETFKEVTGLLKVKNPSMPKEFVERAVDVPAEFIQFFQDMKRYATENRLRNVLSKIGPVAKKDMSKVVGLLAKDLLEDFGNDFPKWKELKKEDQKQVTSKISSLLLNLVAFNWKKIVSGEF